jgi:hypothetical protein
VQGIRGAGGGGRRLPQQRLDLGLLPVAVEEELVEEADLGVELGDVVAGEILDLQEEPLEFLPGVAGGGVEGAGGAEVGVEDRRRKRGCCYGPRMPAVRKARAKSPGFWLSRVSMVAMVLSRQ